MEYCKHANNIHKGHNYTLIFRKECKRANQVHSAIHKNIHLNTHAHTHTRLHTPEPAAPAPPMYPHLGVPLCAATQAGNSVTMNKMRCNYFQAVTCWVKLNGVRNMCCSRTPLLSCRRAFYSSQTEVNALQSNCMPACESVCECVFSIGGEWVGGRGAVRWECGGVGEGGIVVIGGRWKISLWLSSQDMARDIHFSVSLPPTLLSLSISHCCYLSCSLDLFLFLCLLSFLSRSIYSSSLLSFSLDSFLIHSPSFSLSTSLCSHYQFFPALSSPCGSRVSISLFRPLIFPFPFPLHVLFILLLLVSLPHSFHPHILSFSLSLYLLCSFYLALLPPVYQSRWRTSW